MKESLYKKIIEKQKHLIELLNMYVRDVPKFHCNQIDHLVNNIAELKAELEKQRQDPNLCCVCHENYVDSANGYDTCDYCLKNRI